MPYQDRVLTCIECHSEFVFTAGEQMFYAGKGFKNEPRRCKNCKARRTGMEVPRGRVQTRSTTATVCSQCGKETTVPFKLTQGRPVYCLQCYQQRKAAAASANPSP